MSEALIIDKKRVLDTVQNFSSLRSEGIAHIEKLSSDLWTDFNTHDPGITFLELLCYAITELGYRNDFDIVDLLADKNGKTHINQTFYTARKILTNEPLTANDYRKILIDIADIHNAWVFPFIDSDGITQEIPTQEIPIYTDYVNDELTYTLTNSSVELRGLYNVLIDYEFHLEYGDLNSGNVEYSFYEFQPYNVNGIKIRSILPIWNTMWTDADIDYIKTRRNKDILSINITSENNISNGKKYPFWHIQLNYADGTFEYDVVLQSLVQEAETIKHIEFELKEEIHHKQILQLYYKKIVYTKTLYKEIKRKLHAHRNLCEDFIKIESVPSDYLAFCADIDIAPNADREEVLAKVFFEIEKYLNPNIPFYTLEQSFAKGLSADEIFDGPRLLHGFLDTNEVEDAQLKTTVYISDIINLVMDIEGVISIRNCQITRYDEYGVAQLPSQNWCINVLDKHKPVLDIDRSKIIFYANKLPLIAKRTEMYDTLNMLRAENLQNKIFRYAGDISNPEGTYYNFEEFTSIQHDLPKVYGVGEHKLPEKLGKNRLSQAQNLRSYLQLYDQLLADFFSQLAKAKNLFSLDKSIVQTYFSQFLNDKNCTENVYTVAADLENAIDELTDSSDLIRATLFENEDVFYSRRNKFLDHLLARFSESFTDYVLMIYTSYGSNPTQKSDAEIIEDKITFLKEYPSISSRRGKGFDYHSGQIWDARNVSGLEQRMCRITGIDNFYRRYLFCINRIEIEHNDAEPREYFFRIRNSEGIVLLTSIKNYTVQAEINKIIALVSSNIDNKSRYEIVTISAGKFSYQLKDKNGNVIAKSDIICSSNTDAQKAINKLVALVGKECDSEGFHLLEHILLRPRFVPPSTKNNGSSQSQKDYKLMQVCLDEDCSSCGSEDPYSARFTVVIPFWPDKFNDLHFRNYFEQLFYKESPAHCLVKICWLNNVQMLDFEIAYKNWLIALQQFSQDLSNSNGLKNNLIAANNTLVQLLKNLHSVYPEAHLHNCEEGETDPVILGKTILGSM